MSPLAITTRAPTNRKEGVFSCGPLNQDAPNLLTGLKIPDGSSSSLDQHLDYYSSTIDLDLEGETMQLAVAGSVRTCLFNLLL